jgi:hypothetical protein
MQMSAIATGLLLVRKNFFVHKMPYFIVKPVGFRSSTARQLCG